MDKMRRIIQQCMLSTPLLQYMTDQECARLYIAMSVPGPLAYVPLRVRHNALLVCCSFLLNIELIGSFIGDIPFVRQFTLDLLDEHVETEPLEEQDQDNGQGDLSRA